MLNVFRRSCKSTTSSTCVYIRTVSSISVWFTCPECTLFTAPFISFQVFSLFIGINLFLQLLQMISMGSPFVCLFREITFVYFREIVTIFSFKLLIASLQDIFFRLQYVLFVKFLLSLAFLIKLIHFGFLCSFGFDSFPDSSFIHCTCFILLTNSSLILLQFKLFFLFEFVLKLICVISGFIFSSFQVLLFRHSCLFIILLSFLLIHLHFSLDRLFIVFVLSFRNSCKFFSLMSLPLLVLNEILFNLLIHFTLSFVLFHLSLAFLCLTGLSRFKLVIQILLVLAFAI